jgi:putative transposase
VRANQATYPVKTMCRVLEVSRSGFYAWLKREPSARSKANAALLETIKEVHKESDETYGAPRMHAELEERGPQASLNRVARVMREAEIRGVSPRKWKRTTLRGKEARPVPDLVDRDFTATGPNQLWVADITYISTWAGFLFLAIVLDVWSRRVVGWAMATHLRTDLVLEALDMALEQRRPRGVIHHSDQGCQYTSLAFGRRCELMGVRPSMGSVGDAYDNAMAESFFGTLEGLVHRCLDMNRHGVAQLAHGPRAIGQQLRDHRLHRRTGVRRIPRKHLIQHRAERVHVTPWIQFAVAGSLFGTHVFRGAEGQSGLRDTIPSSRTHRQGDSEVRHQRLAILKQDVPGFDIAVDDVASVGVVQRTGNLFGDPHRLLDGKLFLAAQLVLQ